MRKKLEPKVYYLKEDKLLFSNMLRKVCQSATLTFISRFLGNSSTFATTYTNII